MTELTSWPEIERARLVRLCATISGDREAAEDLAQETLLEAWRHRHKLVDPHGADRWLAAIARNVCHRWARTRGRLPVPTDALPEPAAVPDDAVGELLELLPAGARDVLEQRFVHERTHEEIAAALGISADAVAMRLARGKQALRRLLAESEWRPSPLRCLQCGTRKLLMRRDAEEIAFTCPGCAPRDILMRYPLGNPEFARLLADLERPSAMVRRVGEWALRYFSPGDGTSAACTRCGAETTLRAHEREGGARGLYARCGSCGEEVWCSLVGISGGVPEVRELRPQRLVEVREERGAVAVVQSSLDGTRRVTVGFDRASLAFLGTA